VESPEDLAREIVEFPSRERLVMFMWAWGCCANTSHFSFDCCQRIAPMRLPQLLRNDYPRLTLALSGPQHPKPQQDITQYSLVLGSFAFCCRPSAPVASIGQRLFGIGRAPRLKRATVLPMTSKTQRRKNARGNFVERCSGTLA
jgi:hypothetical protein